MGCKLELGESSENVWFKWLGSITLEDGSRDRGSRDRCGSCRRRSRRTEIGVGGAKDRWEGSDRNLGACCCCRRRRRRPSGSVGVSRVTSSCESSTKTLDLLSIVIEVDLNDSDDDDEEEDWIESSWESSARMIDGLSTVPTKTPGGGDRSMDSANSPVGPDDRRVSPCGDGKRLLLADGHASVIS